MNKKEKTQFAELVVNMSVDFLLSKIEWGHYLNTLEMVLKKIKRAKP